MRFFSTQYRAAFAENAAIALGVLGLIAFCAGAHGGAL